MYHSGDGLKKDSTEAAKWYRKAAENGEVNSQYILGFYYATGNGVTQSDVNAYKWWNIAAKQGYEDAIHNLGILAARMSQEDIEQAKDMSR
jgi:TPR repeat protein